MITVKVKDTSLVASTDEPLTSGSVGIKVHYEFSDKWKKLYKVAVFRIGKKYFIANLGYDNTTVELAWELMTKKFIGQTLEVGVCGFKSEPIDNTSDFVYPTIYTEVGKLEQGANPENSLIIEPSKSLILELIDTADKAQKIATEAKAVAMKNKEDIEKTFPKGGMIGQVLIKKSDKDFDTEWKNINGNLPAILSQDEGKFLKVVNFEPKWESILNYEGEYEITPKINNAQILETKEKIMTQNLTVNKIPYYETENLANGNTVYIGKEV